MTSKTIYCTYVTFYSGSKLPPFYIGSSSVEKIERGYHGSVLSKKWKELYKTELKMNKHLFKTEIIELFHTREDALKHELELHISNNVVKSKFFFNEALATVNGFFGMSTKGIPKPEQMKMKMRGNKNASSLKGRKQQKEHREYRLARVKEAGLPDNFGSLVSAGKKAKHCMWMYNEYTSTLINTVEINEAYEQGWLKGRIIKNR